MKATGWALDRIKEAFEQVAQDEAGKAEHCATNHDQKHRLLATLHCASRRTRRRYNVLLGGSLGEKGVTIGGARSVEKNVIDSNQTGSWLYKQVKVLIGQGLQSACGTSGPVRTFD